MPLAETQMATVLSNADPEGKGRVRVRMNWQTDGMQTGWVRVMTPDGGSSKDVKSNRGFVFIPEVGDQVLLGFRHGDPARPYILGSLFNGVTGKGGFAANHKKSLPPEAVQPSPLTILPTPSSYRQLVPIKSSLMN